MFAAFSATLGVIAALFLGFLIFRFWRVALALIVLALIGVGGVVGWVFYDDAHTRRMYDEKVAAEARMSRAVENRSCNSLNDVDDEEYCRTIVTALDRKKLAELDRQKREKAEADARAAVEAAKQPARPSDYQYPPELQPDPAVGPNTLDNQSIKEFLKTLEPKP